MPAEVVAGFWSYAHDDNEMDGGAILELARLVKEEYNLLSGEPLVLFIDHEGITWGQEWRKRIDSALAQTTFFIPIVTPRYFTRSECRRELLEFVAKAKSLGVEELLLPILYAKPRDFSPESPDEAVAIIARTQYVDWRAARLTEFNSRDYRASVSGLARRLLDIAEGVAQNQLDRELSADPESDGVDGITDVIDQVTILLPAWLDAVMDEKVNNAQIVTVRTHFRQQIHKLRAAKAPASAILSAQIREARELLPLGERARKDSRTYLARSVQLDPLISTLARMLAEHPESWPLAMPIREAIDEAMQAINKAEEESKRPGWLAYSETFKNLKHMGRLFQECNSLFAEADRTIVEGNEIVRRWDAELARPE